MSKRKADPLDRLSAFVPHPDSESFKTYILTLLSQRRELQACELKELLLSTASQQGIPPSVFQSHATHITVERERHALQREVPLPLLPKPSRASGLPSCAAAVAEEVRQAGTLLPGGMQDCDALVWHFRGQAAALSVEARELLGHISAVTRNHLGHVTAAKVPAEVQQQGQQQEQVLDQLAHTAPTNADGGCTCEQELQHARRCLAAVHTAQADVAGRIARLARAASSGSTASAKAAVQESDWESVTAHTLSVGAPGRVAQRLFDRLLLLPLSHHHRFPLYEQASGQALARDQHMASAELRVPPRAVRLATDAAATVEALVSYFPEAEALLAGDGSGTTPRAARMREDEAEGGDMDDDTLSQHHKDVYVARKLLPRLLGRAAARWPSSAGGDHHAQPTAYQDQGTPQGLRGAGSTAGNMVVVDALQGPLSALAPSLEGDDSAGHVACLRSLGLHVDEALRGENSFLEVTDPHTVKSRLRALATDHVVRWSVEDTPVRGQDTSPHSSGGALSFGAVMDGLRPVHLQEKQMEALYTLRLLKTQSDRLKVLHCINAMVSIQVSLLRDERHEMGLINPLATRASKPLTCPVQHANSTQGITSPADRAAARQASKRAAAGTRSAGQDTQPPQPASPAAATHTGGRPDAAHAHGGSALATQSAGGASLRQLLLPVDPQLTPAAAGGGDAEEEDMFWEQLAGSGAEVASEGRDVVCEDGDTGVVVRDTQGRLILYRHSLCVFRELEEEVLRVGTRYVEQYAQQLHAAGRGAEAEEIDMRSVLEDVWQYEAVYMAARLNLLLAQFAAYRHATDHGSDDLFAQLGTPGGDVPRPFPGTSGCAAGVEFMWQGQGANTAQPALLAARQQLRREIIDNCFRRPIVDLHDGYFAGRYINATLTIELETALLTQLTVAVHRAHREHIAMMYTSAASAAATAGAASGLSTTGEQPATSPPHSGPRTTLHWRPGLPAGIEYGGLLAGLAPRTPMMEGALMPCIGSAAAQLPSVIRQVVSALADVHQVRHYVELAELRRAVLQSALVELRVLLHEEEHRGLAVPDRTPKDSSKSRDSMGRSDESGDSLPAQKSWLVPSLLADNPVLVLAVAQQMRCPARAALQVMVVKERLIRLLYLTEIQWVVASVQGRALGRRHISPEMQGIDWASLSQDGEPHKPEVAQEVMAACEPSDAEPPGLAAGPLGGAAARPLASAAAHASGMAKGVMVGVGRGGTLGCVWRSPPLALAELFTHPTEMLQVHTLSGLRGLLDPSGVCGPTLAAAAQAQALRAAALQTALEHNQVLLDWVVRKLDRRRRVVMWRAAAVEGVSDDSVLDITVGAPPGQHAPGRYTPTNHINAEQLRQTPPPLLSVPPPARAAQYLHLRRLSASRALSQSGSKRGQLAHSGSSASRNSGSSKRHSSRGSLVLTARDHEQGGDQPAGGSPRSLAGAGGGGADEVVLVDARGLADIRATRRRLVDCVSPLWLDLVTINIGLRSQVRQACVSAMRATAEAASMSSTSGGGGRVSYVGGEPVPVLTGATEADMVRLDVFEEVYLPGLLSRLEGPALRTRLAADVRSLALAVLGSTGGAGHSWGVKFTKDGRRMVDAPEVAPFFDKPGGGDTLLRLLQDYGPLWQAIDMRLADKASDPDPMHWAPLPAGQLPPGLMVLDSEALSLRLDQVWELPCPLDILALAWANEPAHSRYAAQEESSNTLQAAGSPDTHSQVDIHQELHEEGASAAMGGSEGAGPTSSPGPATGTHTPTSSPPVGSRLSGAGTPVTEDSSAAALLAAPPYQQGPTPRNTRGRGSTQALTQRLTRLLTPAERTCLEAGCDVAGALLQLVRCALLQAALLAPSAHLAQGGDLSRPASEAPLSQEEAHDRGEGAWLSQHYPSGKELLEHSGAVVRARLAPLLPGALLAPHLLALHTKLSYLVQPQGFVAGRASTAPVASSTVAAPTALSFLSREVVVQQMAALLGVARARDVFAAAGAQRLRAWHLTVPLELALASLLGTTTTSPTTRILGPRVAVNPPAAAAASAATSILPCAMLRLKDAERVAIHNEIVRIQMLVDRVAAESRIPAGVKPLESLASAEYVLSSLWAHDRLRDAWAWRALLMEAPELYPAAVPSESHYLRRYHTYLLTPPTGEPRPPPASVLQWMEEQYQAQVTQPAAQLCAAAVASSGTAGGSTEESLVVMTSAGDSATAPGKPGWLAQSPIGASSEGLALEAAMVVLRQTLDMQAVQVCLLRLHADCAELAGLQAASAQMSAHQATPLPPALAAAAAGGLPPHPAFPRPSQSGPGVGAQLVRSSPALQALVRKLAAKQRRRREDADVTHTPPGPTADTGPTFEVSADDLAAWLAEAVVAVSGEGRAMAAAAAEGAEAERTHLTHLQDQLSAQVGQLAEHHDDFMRKHAIRIETEVMDRAMTVLQELSQVRRAALRALEDAKAASEAAYLDAQSQHADKIHELRSGLMTAASNAALQRADLQKHALEAMMEVRRETLQKAFGANPRTAPKSSAAAPGQLPTAGASAGGGGANTGIVTTRSSVPQRAAPTGPSAPGLSSSRSHHPAHHHQEADRGAASPGPAGEQEGGGSGNGDVWGMLALEEQIEELTKEVIDMQRAIIKVQTWFKMRASSFQAVCMREVLAARRRVLAAEGRVWELRERHEQELEALALQLRGTQADLEIAGAALAKTTADLTHALSSNKALLAWKVGAQPKMAALTTRLTKITRHREAWLEWVASRQRLLAHVSHALMSAHKAARQHQQLAATPADGREEMAEQLAWPAEKRELKAQLRALQQQLQAQVSARNEAFSRLLHEQQARQAATSHALALGASLSWYQKQQAVAREGLLLPESAVEAIGAAGSAGVTSPAAPKPHSLHCNPAQPSQLSPSVTLPSPSPGPLPGLLGALRSGGAPGVAPVSAEVIIRRHTELQEAYDQVASTERGYLARTLTAVRAVVPEVVAALEVAAPLRAASPSAAMRWQRRASSPARQPSVVQDVGQDGWAHLGPPSPAPPDWGDPQPPSGRLYPLGLAVNQPPSPPAVMHSPRASLLPTPRRRGLALFGSGRPALAKGETEMHGQVQEHQQDVQHSAEAPPGMESVAGGHQAEVAAAQPPPPPPPAAAAPLLGHGPASPGPGAAHSSLPSHPTTAAKGSGTFAGFHVAGTGAAAALAARSPSEAAWQAAQMAGPRLSVEAKRVSVGPARPTSNDQS